MSPLRLSTLLLIIALFSPFAARSHAASLYTYSDLGNLDPRSINAAGMVVGTGINSGPVTGIVYSGYGPNAGQVVAIPGSYDARGINDLGQVVGANIPHNSELSPPTYTSYLATPAPGTSGSLGYTTVN